MKARITYQKNWNEKEGYLVEIKCEDGEWGMDSFYSLTRREGARADEEADFVHYSLVNKIHELSDLGYYIIFK